jgi:fused-like protein
MSSSTPPSGTLLYHPIISYNRTEEIRKIEGSGFGCPIYGFLDPIINILQKLLVNNIILNTHQFRYHREHKRLSDLFSIFEKSDIDTQLTAILVNLSNKTDISPKGFVSLLILVHDSIYSEFKSFGTKIFTVIFN